MNRELALCLLALAYVAFAAARGGAPAAAFVALLGASLVVTLISDNADLQGRLVRSPHVDRLNLGPIPTNQIGWDQPHEGNLFDHLYGRRAIQRVA